MGKLGILIFEQEVGKNWTAAELASDDDMWDDMERGLEETIPEAARIRLRHCMPSAIPPYWKVTGHLPINYASKGAVLDYDIDICEVSVRNIRIPSFPMAL
jgi:hypothetical protein